MSITPQAILMYLGIAALLVAVLFVALAAHTFFHEDIRGVMDDLSGRRRANAVGSAVSRRRTRTTTRRPHVEPAVAGAGGQLATPATGTGGPARSQMTPPATSHGPVAAIPPASRPAVDAYGEDAAETVVDEELGVTRRSLGADFGAYAQEDDIATQVATTLEDGQDGPDAGADAGPATVAYVMPHQDTPYFRVTRRVVAISSDEVIGER